VFRQVLRTIF